MEVEKTTAALNLPTGREQRATTSHDSGQGTSAHLHFNHPLVLLNSPLFTDISISLPRGSDSVEHAQYALVLFLGQDELSVDHTTRLAASGAHVEL